MSAPLKNIRCPRCSKENTWQTENKFRPFCSERCKLIDLGAWADESHRLAGDPVDSEAIDPERE